VAAGRDDPPGLLALSLGGVAAGGEKSGDHGKMRAAVSVCS